MCFSPAIDTYFSHVNVKLKVAASTTASNLKDLAYFYKEGKGLEYMRYSMTEARVVIEQLRKCSISELDTLFNVETLRCLKNLKEKPQEPSWL